MSNTKYEYKKRHKAMETQWRLPTETSENVDIMIVNSKYLCGRNKIGKALGQCFYSFKTRKCRVKLLANMKYKSKICLSLTINDRR